MNIRTLTPLLAALFASALVACGPSEAEIAQMTADAASPTPPPTNTPEPTPTPVPPDLSLTVTDADGNPIAGADVSFPDASADAQVQTGDDGLVSWTALPVTEAAISARAQGYFPAEATLALEPGPNEASLTLERNPDAVLPTEACQPGQEVLFVEDFEDGQAQDWQHAEPPVWEVVEEPERGLVWEMTAPEGSPAHAFYRADYGNAVWEFDVRYGAGQVHFNWHARQETEMPERYLIVYRPGVHAQIMRGSHEAGDLFLAQRFPQPVESGTWQHVAVTYFDGAVEMWVDGQMVIAATDPTPLTDGGLWYEHHPEPGDVPYAFDNVVVCGLSEPYAPPPPPESP